MFKLIMGLLLLIILALGAVLLVKEDPGFVMVKYADLTIETTLAFAIVAVIAMVVVIHFSWKFLRSIWRLPRSVKRQTENRRFEKSRRLLNQGLIDLAEGRFELAENNLIKLVDYSETPLIHYLVAARAAQLQGKYDERDRYLKAAHEAQPRAEIAIGVTQAELQLAHRQTEQSLATLTHLRSIAPRHDYIAMLLARAYYELEDWQALVDLLPEVRKKKLIAEPRLKQMEAGAYKGMLDKAAKKANAEALEKCWNKIPRAQQAEPELLLHYLDLINNNGLKINSAGNLAVKSLDSKWDNRLIDAYGKLKLDDVNAQLKQAEKWLNDYSHNECLLLALGRICMRAQLWGKAQGYLEASIGIKPKPESCLALAELFQQHLKENNKAARYYKQGLELSLKHGQV